MKIYTNTTNIATTSSSSQTFQRNFPQELRKMDIDLRQYMAPPESEGNTNPKSNNEINCSVGEEEMEPSWMGREEEVIPSASQSSQLPVDLTDHFNKIFVKKTFNSFKEFDELFTRFKKETGSVFRIKSSCSIAYENSRRKQHFIPPRFKFVSIKYCCVHYGQPKVSGQGIRTKQRYLPCGCGCVLSVAYNRGALFISQVNMEHNHEVSNKTAPYYAINRRITNNELKQVADVIAVMPSSRALQYFLKERFHKPMTLQDAKNTRARLKAMQMKQGQIESIEVIPSFKGISQISSENDCRAILEIDESEEQRKPEDHQQEEISGLQHDHCEETEKSKAISETVRKFSDLMSGCDSDLFWERIGLMNKVLECWENGENLDVHYASSSSVKSDSIDHCSDVTREGSVQRTDIRTNPYLNIPHDRTRLISTNGDIDQQELADKQLKFLLPLLSDSVQFLPTSEDGSVKLVLPQIKSKVSQSLVSVKRQRGHPKKKEDVNSFVKVAIEGNSTTSCQEKPLYSDSSKPKDDGIISLTESRVTGDNESDNSNSYCSVPFISCITKEPCTELGDQAVEVKIEISNEDTE
ncbi:uncharacterized protein [Palaemon carinicauda]|uniref:uncharacterized protein n=1 Tax=Palaemon carinicauda TaxID=392227 RepID=UPI0035B65B72